MSRSLTTVAVVLVLSSAPALAHDVREIVDYSITTWSMKDGLPSSVVWSIAQDGQGYLWLGTDAGLVRFDGVRFVAWDVIGRTPLPKQLAKVVTISRDGSLWIGYGEGDGGVARISNGDVSTYGIPDGLGRGPVSALLEDDTGTVWASNSSGLYRLGGTRWERFPLGSTVGDASVQTAFIDRAGDLFVATPSAVFRRAFGQDAFRQVEVSDGFRGRMIRQGASGSTWITDPAVGFRRLGERAPHHPGRGLGMALLQDRVENLWVATLGQGLWRVPRFEASPRLTVEKSTTRNGLSNDVVLSLFEDREGNIWAGTNEGLNRLTPHKVTPVTHVGNVSTLVMSPAGEVWVANDRALIRLTGTSGRRLQRPAWIAKPGVRALHVDRAGTLWVATSHELARLVHGAVQPVRLPADARLNDIRSVASDIRGAVWIADGQRGVFQWCDGELRTFTPPTTIDSTIASVLYSDSSGRVWIAYDNGTLVAVGANGVVNRYAPQQLTGDSRYTALYEDSRHAMWLGGFGWLSRLQDSRFQTVTRNKGFPAGYVKAISEVGAEMWIATDAGIVRVERDVFDRVSAQPSGHLRFRLYDTSDGLAGTPVFAGNRLAARTPDGRLWFVTGNGLTVVDPRALPGTGSHGPVRIEGLVADGHGIADLGHVTLPPHTTTIEIAYTAVNLTAPHKTRFRYRLHGFDTDWIDAGARRAAFYTNLPPRTYQFQVIGDNDDGSSSELAAPLEIVINPTFYQTTWFYGFCAATLSVVVWGLWRLRLLQLRREFSVVLGERLRLSREIHDTLLQGLFGVSLQLNALSRTLESAPALAGARLARLRSLVDEYIRETRQSISDLRSPLLETAELPAALRHVGDAATDGTDVSFELAVTGTPRRLSPQTEEQVLRIGQEAVSNAVRHAGARHVRMTIHYEKRSVTLRVDDDGRGFEVAALVDTGGAHYGLRSMKERAEAVGGSLRLVSTSGKGTQVEAVVPR